MVALSRTFDLPSSLEGASDSMRDRAIAALIERVRRDPVLYLKLEGAVRRIGEKEAIPGPERYALLTIGSQLPPVEEDDASEPPDWATMTPEETVCHARRLFLAHVPTVIASIATHSTHEEFRSVIRAITVEDCVTWGIPAACFGSGAFFKDAQDMLRQAFPEHNK